MRKLLQGLWVCFLVLNASAVFGIENGLDDEDGWSWRDGLIGPDSPRVDPFTDGFAPGYLCAECRDPSEHPMDFVALAYNGYFGDDAWMWESNLGFPFRIYNLDGQYVVVWFEDFIFDGISLLPDLLTIQVRLENGQVLTFSVLQDGPDLRIGDPNPEPPQGGDCCGCGCAGGGGSGGQDEGEDDFTDPDEGLPEPADSSEPTGVVSIVDPDEDDEFPEWEL